MLRGCNLAGSNSHRGRVENDFYATHPDSVKRLLEKIEIDYPALEPACGQGHISKLLDESRTTSTDLIYRGYGEKDSIDFLNHDWGEKRFNTIITNPPFSLFLEFAKKALLMTDRYVIFFGKLQALEGVKRSGFLMDSPLKTVYVFRKRQQPLRNGMTTDFRGKKLSNTMAFAWFVWEIGYTGKPTIEWL